MSPTMVSPTISMEKCEKISALLATASAALNDEFPPNVQAAFDAYQQALGLDENNVDVLDAFGELLANLGDSERAMEVLIKSAQLSPEKGPMKYFYLGQMLERQEALQAYKKCYALLETSDELSVQDRTERMTCTLCAIGELFMTDLCDEEEAEAMCKEAFERAVQLSPNSVEALNGIATFHRMKLEIEESRSYCQRAFGVMEQLLEAPDLDSESLDQIAPLPLRQRFAENLVELELIDEALAVLSTILEEDEEDIQSWFLTACCHLVAKQREEADECIKQAKRLLKKSKAQLPPQVVEHWTKNLNDLQTRLTR